MGIGSIDLFELIFRMSTVVVIFAMIFIGIKLMITIKESREEWKKDDGLPLPSVEATVVTKWERKSIQTGITGKSTTFISYHATFEFENGDRKEFSISMPEYNLIVEGDVVQLSLQGTRFIKVEKRRF